jgi:hypothetical protein
MEDGNRFLQLENSAGSLMTTLFDATLALARILGIIYEGTATGGSATTLVDTTRAESADYFNQGTIWIRSGNNSGKSAVITDWALAGTTYTFPTLTLLCAAGDLYSACTGEWQRGELINCINMALQKIGRVAILDTSLAVVADQEAYDLPVGVSGLLRVEVAQDGATYVIHQQWREENDDLMFDVGHAPGSGSIRLTYAGAHLPLTTDGGVVSSQVSIEWLKWSAAVFAWRRRLQQSEGKESWILRMINEALAQEAAAAGKYPIEIDKDAHLARWL